ncbi:uncharacterized protein [Dermacentor andersoni]|uniref:uncharacterized protein n=1 Tax=Dermacentor andersoni TaxID=34620 RepID=UPI002415B76D|nr:uncharacterized protein LOC129385613 [Dermacentor andersoni]
MSQGRPGPAPRRGSDMVVLVSASHTRMCGPAAAVEHERQASAAAIEAPTSSRRRSSYVVAQQPQNAVVTEETNGQDFECNVGVAFEEESRTPIVRLVHHGPRAYVEMIDREAHSNRHSSSPQPPMVVSRSPSPLSRTSSPFSRPPTPIARPSSPKFRAMSPMQVARLSSYRAANTSNVGSPMSPRFPQPALDSRCIGHKRSRSGSWPFPRSAPSSRPQSGTALLKIVEDCMLCAKKSKMLDEQRAALAASPNDLQRRREVTDIVPSACPAPPVGSSATAAIVAAAASAAGIQLEANGNEIEPCLDCLEEFVRRKRVEKGEAGITSAERLCELKGKAGQFQRASSPLASSERKEVLKATTVSSRVSTTDIAVSKRPGSRNAPAGGATDGVSSACTGQTSSSIHQGPASSSPQSPSPYRCPVCNACKCCGSIPPNCKT